MNTAEQQRLVERHTPLVWAIVRRFMGRGVEAEDLFQLGSIGLLKAIQGYDESYGTQFSTYAVPLIMGEIRRFLRDDGPIRVSRSIREKAVQIARAREAFAQAHGREPGIAELTSRTGLTAEEIALCAGAGQAVLSLDAPLSDDGEGSLLDLQADPHREENLLESIALREAIGRLEPMEQEVIALRYFRGMTQQKTGEVLGLTQVKISRMEKKILQKLQAFLQ